MKKLLIIMLAMLIALFFVACPEPVAKYTLTVNTSGTGTVSFDPIGGTYDSGTVVTLTATPGTNYTFSGWSGDLSGSTSPTTITMDSDKTVAATFTQNITQTVATPTFNPNGGTFSSSQSVTISCATSGTTIKYTTNGSTPSQTNGTTYTTAINLTSTTTLKAIAYKTGMNDSQVASATFTKNTTQYTLTVTFTNGTVTANGTPLTSGVASTYDEGTNISLQATPSASYEFTSWSGSITGSTNPATLTMNGNKTITAIFTATSGEDIDSDGKVNTIGVWLPGKWVLSSSSMLHTYYFNSVIGQTYKVAIDDNNTGFWTPATTGNPTPTADTDHQVTTISGTSYTYVSPSGTGWKDSDYSSTDYITVVATENQIKFQVRPYNNSTSYVGNYFLKVVQVLPQYTLTVTPSGNGYVELNPAGGVYDEGTTVTLTAVPNGSDTFTSWGGDLSGSTNPTTIIMNANKTVTATFTGTTPQNEWLIMMYMGGDTNLEAAMWADVNEVEVGLYNLSSTVRAKTKVIVLWDGSSTNSGIGYTSVCPSGSVLYEMGPESSQNTEIGSSTINKSSSASWLASGEVNMANGTTLTNFLNWCNTNYPNYTNHMLVLSDHGGGQRSSGRAAVWDDGDGGFDNVIFTKELQQALSSAGYSSSNKLAILGFDACLMAGVEEAYQHRNVASYLVASLETEQGDGWEYQHWIPQMTLGITPAQLGTILVQSYRTNFDSNYYNDQTLSCTDLSKMDTLKTKIDALVVAIVANSQQSNAKTQFGSSQTFEGTYTYLIEIGDFASKVRSLTGLTTAADEVIAAMTDAIVYSWADTNSGNYYGAGSTTKKGLHICGKTSGNDGGSANIFPSWYTTTNLDFVTTGSAGVDTWAELLDYWY